MKAGAAVAPPRVAPRRSGLTLALAAMASILLWQAGEHLASLGLHPRHADMLAAARTLQEASRVIAAAKTARGSMQADEIDPNRTGLIGPEMTEITTTLGDLGSKRTVTNPDFAAALVRLIDPLALPKETPVAMVLSGSFVGADIAAVIALESLGLEPVIVASLTASMYGATEPGFNILDMLGLLRRRGVIRSRVQVAVLGGERGLGAGIGAEAIALLKASAAREGALLVDETPFPRLVDRVADEVGRLSGAARPPGLAVNVGGAQVALGSCAQSFELPPGLTTRTVACTGGTPGLVLRLAAQHGIPVLHIINIRRLSLDMGLPFDPRPLPEPGTNPAVYGAGATRSVPGGTP